MPSIVQYGDDILLCGTQTITELSPYFVAMFLLVRWLRSLPELLASEYLWRWGLETSERSPMSRAADALSLCDKLGLTLR